MFEVAFSRRMCCSRVCSASRYAWVPSASRDTPTSRPGSDRSSLSRTEMKPGVRAAVEQRHAEPLAGADGHVGTPLAGRRAQR